MTQSRLLVMPAASGGVSPAARPARAGKKSRLAGAENPTLPCAAGGLDGIIVRRLSCPRLLANTVLRATPSFGNTSGGAGVCHA